MIVDTHIHYMQPPSSERPYAADGNPVAVISVEDFIAIATSAGVDQLLQIATSTMGYDNRYSLEGARQYPQRIVGVEGRLDPFAPEIAGRLREFMSQPGMIGTRLQIRKNHPSGEWLTTDALDPFFAALEAQNVFVGISSPGKARELAETAKRFPGLRIISEHMTLKIGMDDTAWDEAWPHILTLASCPNIWLKLSYLPESAPPGERFPFPTSQKRFRRLYETVGAARMIWGSNYPPSKEVCSYAESVDFIRNECDFLAPGERAGILGDTFLKEFVSARSAT